MGKLEYDELMKLLCFMKMQNDAIIQLLLDDKKYKRDAYKKVYKDMVEEWEKKIEEMGDKIKNEEK